MRSKAHILETIACRAFERALSPRIVCNPPLQGRDYGWDYQCTDFDKSGKITREFKVQVKHLTALSPVVGEEAPHVRHYYILTLLEPSLAKHELKTSYINDWIDPQKTPTPILFVLANKTRLVFAWVQDIYDFYLRWVPLNNQDSVTIYLTDIRQLTIKDGQPTLWLNREPDGEGWIDEQIAPGNLDAIFHIGMSLFLRSQHCGEKFVREFDGEGFFQMLEAGSRSKPWQMLAFASFLGAISPTKFMEDWAFQVVSDWDNPYFIPAAIQILSLSTNSDLVEPVLKRFARETPSREGARVYGAMVEKSFNGYASSRFIAEFSIAAGMFLEHRVRHLHCELSQALLVDTYCYWDPHTTRVNVATPALERLINEGVLIKNDSYQQLVKFCHRYVSADPTSEQLKEGIHKEDERWFDRVSLK